MTERKQRLRPDPLRPLEPGWLESEAEQKARAAFAHQRCNLMESALRRIGFAAGSQIWVVGVMIAKISDGWLPLKRDLSSMANDRDFTRASKSQLLESRKRMLRRALHELRDWDLIQFETTDSTGARRTRRSTTAVIMVDPKRLTQIAAGDYIPTRSQQAEPRLPDICPDNEPDICRTNAGQIQPRSLCISLSLNSHKSPTNPTPGDTVVVEGKELISFREMGADPSWTSDEFGRLTVLLRGEGMLRKKIPQALRACVVRQWSVADVEKHVAHWRESGVEVSYLANWLEIDGSAPKGVLRHWERVHESPARNPALQAVSEPIAAAKRTRDPHVSLNQSRYRLKKELSEAGYDGERIKQALDSLEAEFWSREAANEDR